MEGSMEWHILHQSPPSRRHRPVHNGKTGFHFCYPEDGSLEMKEGRVLCGDF